MWILSVYLASCHILAPRTLIWLLDFWKICAPLVILYVALGGIVVSVLTTGPKVRGFDPDRGRWIFKGDKNP